MSLIIVLFNRLKANRNLAILLVFINREKNIEYIRLAIFNKLIIESNKNFPIGKSNLKNELSILESFFIISS